MERRQVLLVDAFADEPTGGRQIPVLPSGGDLSESQRVTVAEEFRSPGVATVQDGQVVYTEDGQRHATIEGGIAGLASLFERGYFDTGTQEITAGNRSRSVEIDSDGTVWIETEPQAVTDSAATEGTIADALGIDVAALRDVGADLPIASVSGRGGSLLVPVNFFEHLSGADPDGAALADLLASEGATRLFVFTFDTLAAESDAHARVFDTVGRASSCVERATSGAAAVALGAHLSGQSVLDADRTAIRIECGHVLDRPATMQVTLEDAPSVGGRAVTSLDGEMVLPDEDPDDIIEV